MKKQLLFGIIAVALTLLVFLFKYNQLPGAGNIIYLSIITMLIITIVKVIRKKKQRLLYAATGSFWILFTIILSGTSFKMMNWSKTIFWPTPDIQRSSNYMDADYSSYAWPTSAPEKFGISQSLIDETLISKLGSLDFPLSLVIIKDDTLITEKYFRGMDENTAFNIQSATKSIVSILVGIAIDKGILKDEDVRINDMMPEYYNETTEKIKASITLKHLLTMQAGWGHNDNEIRNGYDWLKSAMSVKLQYEPGTAFLYSNVCPHILVHVLENQSGQDINDFANTNLCKPLNITIADWLKSPNGQCIGGGGLFMTSRDMAKFGQLLLKQGTIDDKKIVDSAWIQKATMNYINKSLMSIVPEKGYGYLIWTDNYKNHEIWLAAGAGGQYIMVVPDIKMILVTTAITTLSSEQQDKNALQILGILNDFVYSQLEKYKMNN